MFKMQSLHYTHHSTLVQVSEAEVLVSYSLLLQAAAMVAERSKVMPVLAQSISNVNLGLLASNQREHLSATEAGDFVISPKFLAVSEFP